jgi:hypothetical protein
MLNALSIRPVDRGRTVSIERRKVEVGMGIDQGHEERSEE